MLIAVIGIIVSLMGIGAMLFMALMLGLYMKELSEGM